MLRHDVAAVLWREPERGLASIRAHRDEDRRFEFDVWEGPHRVRRSVRRSEILLAAAADAGLVPRDATDLDGTLDGPEQMALHRLLRPR